MEELFQSIGLSESKAKDTLKNTNVSNVLKSYILQVRFYCLALAFAHIRSLYAGKAATEWRG